MIRVKNGPAIRRISYGTLKAAGKRNLVAVLAIALTCLLFTGVLTVGLSLVEYLENQTMRQVGTSAHAGFKMITQAQYDKVAGDPEIKDISYNIHIRMNPVIESAVGRMKPCLSSIRKSAIRRKRRLAGGSANRRKVGCRRRKTRLPAILPC